MSNVFQWRFAAVLVEPLGLLMSIRLCGYSTTSLDQRWEESAPKKEKKDCAFRGENYSDCFLGLSRDNLHRLFGKG